MTKWPAIALTAMLFLAAALTGQRAMAHHGWSWTSGGDIELTGLITAAKLGNPHGVLTVDVDGEVWTVEVGQPWRNERAGLKDGDLSEGVEIRVIGQPAANVERRVIKAETLFIGDVEYVLYPDRR